MQELQGLIGGIAKYTVEVAKCLTPSSRYSTETQYKNASGTCRSYVELTISHMRRIWQMTPVLGYVCEWLVDKYYLIVVAIFVVTTFKRFWIAGAGFSRAVITCLNMRGNMCCINLPFLMRLDCGHSLC